MACIFYHSKCLRHIFFFSYLKLHSERRRKYKFLIIKVLRLTILTCKNTFLSISPPSRVAIKWLPKSMLCLLEDSITWEYRCSCIGNSQFHR